MESSTKSALINTFQQQFGDKFTTNLTLRTQHAHTQTWLPNQPADGVLFAENKQMVIDAVNICHEYRCPLIPFGTGSSLEGQVNAPQGGICIDTSRMDQIITIHQDDLAVTLQPGVTREALNTALRHTGLFFPIDPGANASLGGMASTRASGTNAVLYGTMKDVVLNLEVVLADGRLIRTASRAKKSAAGYDLTHLFIGSEGTLGIITELTLKVFARPEQVAGGVCAFPSILDACNAVIMTIQSGIPVSRLELLDPLQIRACNQYSKLAMPEKPTLFVEFHGSATHVKQQAEQFAAIAEEQGAEPFQWSSDESALKQLWKARHNAYFATQLLRPQAQAYVSDACVPISRLAECVEQTRLDLEESQLIATIVGHVGDGNFHVCLMVDPKDAHEIECVEAFLARISERAISMEGTCTGEHGIGQGKQAYLRKELGEAVDVMLSIKQALDPYNLMNPAKIFS
ncbi:FAD-binding oxidoreductase [Thiolinea disciformis]|uniref:FAD-binding oxidoreductase n=1 Tax=Thiolinea disciformis TaxID=125614 RepID=UPI0003656C23|nr:FAD-linked oxidase C-terminal domain-containing protein [Thiolinea disciformis]